jgi:hypothetical protein
MSNLHISIWLSEVSLFFHCKDAFFKLQLQSFKTAHQSNIVILNQSARKCTLSFSPSILWFCRL